MSSGSSSSWFVRCSHIGFFLFTFRQSRFHIIQLTDIKSAKQRSFEETKPELIEDVKKQQAQKKFAETAETFTNAVYEQSDSLKPIADKLKLEVKTATNVTRNPAAGAVGAEITGLAVAVTLMAGGGKVTSP